MNGWILDTCKLRILPSTNTALIASRFDQNLPDMKISCEQYGVSNDSDEEIQDMKDAIQQVSNVAEIDPRFILAIIMQESSGCVRVSECRALFTLSQH